MFTKKYFLITLLFLMHFARPVIYSMTEAVDLGACFIMATIADEASNKDFMCHAPYHLAWDYVEHCITTYHIGGLIFLGTSTKSQLAHAIHHFQAISKKPLLICIDAEWGLAMRCHDAYPYPKAALLGTMSNHDLYTLGYLIGKECKEMGIHINFAPVADVNTNSCNPIIGARSFGSDPYLVAEKAYWYAQGLRDAGIIACAKHFPGHGDTTVDSHDALPIMSHKVTRLQQIELVPFHHLIQHTIPLIMIGHLLVPTWDPLLPASLSKTIIQNLLRKEMQFKGIVITDGLGMRSVSNLYTPGELELRALQAGNDLLLCPLDVERAITAITHEAAHNAQFAQQRSESLQRIEQFRNILFL